MAGIDQFAAAGLDRIQWGYVDSAGFFIGAAGTTLANGSDAGMSRLVGAQAAPVAINEPTRVNVLGDDGAIAQFVFKPSELPSFIIELGAEDLNFMAAAQNSSVYDMANVSWSFIAGQPNVVNLSSICLILTAQAVSKASGSDGNLGYYHLILPKCQVFPLHTSGLQSAQETAFRYLVIAQEVDTTPWGESMNTVLGVPKATMIPTGWTGDRFSMHALTGDGTTVSFTVDLTPSNVATEYTLWKDGVDDYANIASVTPATKTVVVTAAPAAAVKDVLLYEFTAE